MFVSDLIIGTSETIRFNALQIADAPKQSCKTVTRLINAKKSVSTSRHGQARLLGLERLEHLYVQPDKTGLGLKPRPASLLRTVIIPPQLPGLFGGTAAQLRQKVIL